ncbi:unnamed protein product [Protopolystoma xenopodis]|uniref:Uncharacterized protein n=1 Tax=Protopolystoma xenopodis TaxID=117903 RepID=A0A3S5BWL0_9PLAT|nr:unnamed protein product [Protopolystoma xenopodis]
MLGNDVLLRFQSFSLLRRHADTGQLLVARQSSVNKAGTALYLRADAHFSQDRRHNVKWRRTSRPGLRRCCGGSCVRETRTHVYMFTFLTQRTGYRGPRIYGSPAIVKVASTPDRLPDNVFPPRRNTDWVYEYLFILLPADTSLCYIRPGLGQHKVTPSGSWAAQFVYVPISAWHRVNPGAEVKKITGLRLKWQPHQTARLAQCPVAGRSCHDRQRVTERVGHCGEMTQTAAKWSNLVSRDDTDLCVVLYHSHFYRIADILGQETF